MLECLKFILNCVIEFLSMLFTIDVGFTNLGALMCIIFIFLPTILFIVNFIKSLVFGEFDELYDESRSRETVSSTLTERHNFGNGKTITSHNTLTSTRRFRNNPTVYNRRFRK